MSACFKYGMTNRFRVKLSVSGQDMRTSLFLKTLSFVLRLKPSCASGRTVDLFRNTIIFSPLNILVWYEVR